MIRSVRKKHSRPERVNYLASVSDLMSALLFVFILTLAVAIIQARTAAGRADEEARHAKEAAERARIALENLNQVQGRLTIVEERLEGNSRALKAFLEQLKTSLEEQGIMVDIDTVRGVLRVPESAVTFGVGLNTLDDSNTTATRHWTERREFWLRYWRAGRFKKCRVYAASPTRHAELVKRFKNKYPSLISRLGVLNGRTGPSFLMFLFELRGDVVISEFSDMGKVRVGYRTSKITTTRGTIHWWDLLSKEYVKYDFTHSGDWKQQADAAIEELTHERVPR